MNDTSLTFLKTLYRLLDPNPDDSLSMYDVGTAMDLGREESSQAAQQLMADGLVDVRTLAGAIGITADGLALLETTIDATPGEAVTLDKDGIVSPAAKDGLQEIAAQMRTTLGSWNLDTDNQAELMADLETIDAQMASPKPKNAVLRTAAESLHTLLNNLDQDDPCLDKLSQLLA